MNLGHTSENIIKESMGHRKYHNDNFLNYLKPNNNKNTIYQNLRDATEVIFQEKVTILNVHI